RGSDPRERVAQVVRPSDQPSGLRAAGALDVRDRRLTDPQPRERTRPNQRLKVSPAKNQPTASATRPRIENSTIANPRVTSRNPGTPYWPGIGSVSPMFATAVTIPHAQTADSARNPRPRTNERPSSQSWAAVASLSRRRSVRYGIGYSPASLASPLI